MPIWPKCTEGARVILFLLLRSAMFFVFTSTQYGYNGGLSSKAPVAPGVIIPPDGLSVHGAHLSGSVQPDSWMLSESYLVCWTENAGWKTSKAVSQKRLWRQMLRNKKFGNKYSRCIRIYGGSNETLYKVRWGCVMCANFCIHPPPYCWLKSVCPS